MSEEEVEKTILDLSKKQLKKVPKQEDAQNVRTLILDENELQKIDNIDAYLKIESLSLSRNQLLRMYGVCRLHNLRELNLSFNGILSIEGLKECIHLRRLNLEGNNIKTIEHLQNNTKLEYLNLGENSIGSISDISFLKCLKELYLHNNRLTHLRQCDKYLPISLEVITFSKNNISDLNEICTLSNLCNLHTIAIGENPCVLMTSGTDGFDYRPFVLNWCMSLKVIDGFVVDPIESLKAEWLYSQGRGRQFRLGEQTALAKYLSSVCPLTGKALENENERKLRLILSKAQQHQRQLQEEISENSNTSGNNSPSSARKKPTSRIQSPRFSRLTGRQGSPESMISSYHGNTSNDQSIISSHNQMATSLIENIRNESLLSQSLDTSFASSSVSTKANSLESTPRNITPNPYSNGGPLVAASKMVPVPETLMSPDVCPTSVTQRIPVSAINTHIPNSKTLKNKDNKLNSPKTRSPHLKRNAERSPQMSPRKNSLNNAHNLSNQHKTPLAIHNQSNVQLQANPHVQISGQVDNQTKSRLMGNSMHVQTLDADAGVLSSDDDSDNINVDKLKTIRNKAAQRCKQNKEINDNSNVQLTVQAVSSAILIQKIWRGYRTRKKTKDIAEKLLKKRTHEYIYKLTKDMEMTKAQLENERKIQQLQMQAINALWKKVSTMQGLNSVSSGEIVDGKDTNNDKTEIPTNDVKTLSLDNNSAAVVNDLAKTCANLTIQVQQLQGSMRDMLNCLTLFCNVPQENIKRALATGIAEALSQEKCDSAATQTEIIAVHTPQIENQTNFPFIKARPSSLPLETKKTNCTTSNLSEHANHLVEECEEPTESALIEDGDNNSGSSTENADKSDIENDRAI